MNELKIHDIKVLETIPDYSFYIFALLCLLAVLTVCFLIYLLYKRVSNKKKSLKELAMEKLKDLDLENSKKCAYRLSIYGRYFLDDKRCKRLYDELQDTLHQYKYKKEVASFDKEVKEQIRRFLDAIDV